MLEQRDERVFQARIAGAARGRERPLPGGRDVERLFEEGLQRVPSARASLRRELLPHPGARHVPVPLDRALGHVHRVGDFPLGQAGEEAHLDDLRLSRVDRPQPREQTVDVENQIGPFVDFGVPSRRAPSPVRHSRASRPGGAARNRRARSA